MHYVVVETAATTDECQTPRNKPLTIPQLHMDNKLQ